MSYTSSMGTFCFLFTFLHPAALGLLSPPRQSTHTRTHTNGGIRQRRRHKLDRDGFLNDVSGLTADDYDKKQFPSQFQVTFPSSVCPIYLCFFFLTICFLLYVKKKANMDSTLPGIHITFSEDVSCYLPKASL